MEKNKGPTNAEVAQRLADNCLKIGHGLYQVVLEISDGFKSKTIPVYACLIPGIFFCFSLILNLDKKLLPKLLFNVLHYSNFIFLPVYFLGVSLGFWIWGGIRAKKHFYLNQRIKNLFIGIRVKNGWKETPQFISDTAIDPVNRCLKLKRQYITLEQFKTHSNAIAEGLHVYIESVEEAREDGTIDIFYSTVSMPQKFMCTDYQRFPDFSFLVGKTRGKEITSSLVASPHLLVAGESGGGKSSFLRHFITTLYLNNPGIQFLFIDLKENLEGQVFDGLDRVGCAHSASEAVMQLTNVRQIMRDRFAQLKAARAKDLEEYEKIRNEKQQTIEGANNPLAALSRYVVVIDEAAQLYLVTNKNNAVLVNVAREIVSEIARMGRALGVHLVFGTQRPDVSAIDSQVKSCLTQVLAFKAANNASSMTILDNTRAANLPKVPGRAIWKIGGEMTEIQTPLLEKDRACELLGTKHTDSQAQTISPQVTAVRHFNKIGRFKTSDGDPDES